MASELGLFALILAFLASIAQTAGLFAASDATRRLVVRCAAGQFAFVLIAFLALTFAYATSDFSVLNVAQNSHTAKPFIYKLSGVWGNHEGSMLLWALILAAYGGAFVRTTAPPSFKTRALAVQGALAAAFLAFLLFASNPFARLFPAPLDGSGLNPLLQDPGLAIHPPFLYLGYVGFSMTFALAVAALIEGRAGPEWARLARPWALTAWTFLTIGISLGSWWAYYELGWGGWWAWDPVENASFMPWLAGTAFIHSIKVVERRGALVNWTVLLAILTFSLSLIGTFLVRSGLITSVHAFASDPSRGLFILFILGGAIGGALSLYAWRAPQLAGAAFKPVSREGALLLNNVVLAAAAGIVFIGTFYPLFLDVASGAKISVGPPYYNLVFGIIAVPFALAMGAGPFLAWKKGRGADLLRNLRPAAAALVVAAILAAWMTETKVVQSALAFGVAAWLFVATLGEWAGRVKLMRAPLSESFSRAKGLPRGAWGMTTAHLGLGVLGFAIAAMAFSRTDALGFLEPGGRLAVAGYEVTLEGVEQQQGPNYLSEIGTFALRRNGDAIDQLRAERRFYPVRRMQTTEAGITSRLRGDVYVTIGERRDELGGWPVHLYFNPLAPFLWLGMAMAAAGGLLSLSDRLRFSKAANAPAATSSGAAKPAAAPAE